MENNLKDLVMLMTDIAPRETLVTMLDGALTDYKKSKSDEAFARLGSVCLMIGLKHPLEQVGLEKVSAISNRMHQGAQMLDPDKFKS